MIAFEPCCYRRYRCRILDIYGTSVVCKDAEDLMIKSGPFVLIGSQRDLCHELIYFRVGIIDEVTVSR